MIEGMTGVGGTKTFQYTTSKLGSENLAFILGQSWRINKLVDPMTGQIQLDGNSGLEFTIAKVAVNVKPAKAVEVKPNQPEFLAWLESDHILSESHISN